MGSICPCLIRQTKIQRPNPYDAHETYEVQEHGGSLPSGTKQDFHMFAEEPAPSGNIISKQSSVKTSKLSMNKEQFSKNRGMQEQVNQQQAQGQAKADHKSSTKSLIRKRLSESIGQNSGIDQSFQNLDKSRKIIRTIYNPKRSIVIRSCKKSSIFIFDISASIQIEKCSDCLIFCAPCSGRISVQNCKQMKLILISSKLEIRNSKYCEISLFCANPPRIIGSSEICFSNFLRIGYYDMTEQMSSCNLEVWNNRFLQIQDQDQDPDEQHCSQKKLHIFEIEWEKVLEEGQIEPGDPVIPMVWGDMKLNKKKQILIMNQPLREIQLKLIRYIVSNNISIHKGFKGVLGKKAFEKMRELFSYHQENKYLCLMVGKELQASGFEAYFEKISGKDVDEIQKQIFPQISKEQ